MDGVIESKRMPDFVLAYMQHDGIADRQRNRQTDTRAGDGTGKKMIVCLSEPSTRGGIDELDLNVS